MLIEIHQFVKYRQYYNRLNSTTNTPRTVSIWYSIWLYGTRHVESGVYDVHTRACVAHTHLFASRRLHIPRSLVDTIHLAVVRDRFSEIQSEHAQSIVYQT